MFPYSKINVSVPPMKMCFLSVDPDHDYYLHVWKNSISSFKILQNLELVRVKYGNMRIFPGTTIHRCRFKIMISNKHFRSQLHIYMIIIISNPRLITITLTNINIIM